MAWHTKAHRGTEAGSHRPHERTLEGVLAQIPVIAVTGDDKEILAGRQGHRNRLSEAGALPGLEYFADGVHELELQIEHRTMEATDPVKVTFPARVVNAKKSLSLVFVMTPD